jgi:phage replication-related protein YjqB (UPF0714/DUF867 family)
VFSISGVALKEKYKNYKELKEGEKKDRDYQILFRRGVSGIAVMAPHGGGIEPGTSEIADRIAGDEHSFYSFEGLKQKGSFDLHITSTLFDEPVGISIAMDSTSIVALHGCIEKESVVYIGGRDTILKDKIRLALAEAGFWVQENSIYPGMDPMNICNRSRLERGVQLEISIGLRLLMFKDLSRTKRNITTRLFREFVEAVRSALSDHHCTAGPLFPERC